MSEIIQALQEPFGDDAIQRTRGSQTGRGYDTTGVGYAYVVQRLNSVLGLSWEHRDELIQVTDVPRRSGRLAYEVVIRVVIRVYDGDRYIERSGYGWHVANFLGDAYKGASTNGLKKAAAMFSVAIQAYMGILDDDHQPLPDDRAPVQDPAEEAAAKRQVTELAKVYGGDRLKKLKADTGAGSWIEWLRAIHDAETEGSLIAAQKEEK